METEGGRKREENGEKELSQLCCKCPAPLSVAVAVAHTVCGRSWLSLGGAAEPMKQVHRSEAGRAPQGVPATTPARRPGQKTHRRDILARELIRCVGDQQTRLTDGTVANHDALDRLHGGGLALRSKDDDAVIGDSRHVTAKT